MEGDILNLNKIKVYYPFLNDNDGNKRSLSTELSFLIGYLLISDVIVVPPRSFFGGPFGINNVELCNKSKVLIHLINSGKIITTSSSTEIRDSFDLSEYYGGFNTSSAAPLRMYRRDSRLQKEAYLNHFTNHIQEAQYYKSDIKKELLGFMSGLPDHPSVLLKIDSIKSEINLPEFERLRKEALHGYFSGGAVGNDAIMPIMKNSDGKSVIYNPFYGKKTVAIFMTKIQHILNRELINMPVSHIDKVISNLAIFRIKYAKLVSSYQEYYLKITKLMEKNSISIRLPTDFLYVAVATTITAILADAFTAEILIGSAFLMYTAKGTWGYINRILKITDYFSKVLQRYLSCTGLYKEFRPDISELLDEFRESVIKAIAH